MMWRSAPVFFVLDSQLFLFEAVDGFVYGRFNFKVCEILRKALTRFAFGVSFVKPTQFTSTLALESSMRFGFATATHCVRDVNRDGLNALWSSASRYSPLHNFGSVKYPL
jgi:hypothetical protein